MISRFPSEGTTVQSHNDADWFYPEWTATAPFNQPIAVRDTDSLSSETKCNTPADLIIGTVDQDLREVLPCDPRKAII